VVAVAPLIRVVERRVVRARQHRQHRCPARRPRRLRLRGRRERSIKVGAGPIARCTGRAVSQPAGRPRPRLEVARQGDGDQQEGQHRQQRPHHERRHGGSSALLQARLAAGPAQGAASSGPNHA